MSSSTATEQVSLKPPHGVCPTPSARGTDHGRDELVDPRSSLQSRLHLYSATEQVGILAMGPALPAWRFPAPCRGAKWWNDMPIKDKTDIIIFTLNSIYINEGLGEFRDALHEVASKMFHAAMQFE